ncbi:MFS transporter [Candidatus Fermentibacteria bacterium]|nr:MFS transporter [Candidatus Fermentibacteria bacterium]
MRQLLRVWWPRLELNPLEQLTFRRHVLAALFDGAYAGLVAMTAYILRKQLDATDFQIALLFALQMSMFTFSSVGAAFITYANHRSFILAAGLFGRLLYVTVLFCHGPFFLIGIIAWVSLVHANYLPAQNMIFRANYRRETRGVCYARAQIVALLAMSVAAASVGRVLNWRAESFPLVFAAAGILGFCAYMTYRSMPHRSAEAVELPRRRVPFADFFQILRGDGFFRRYEAIFFLYGIAFMMAEPLVPMFVNDVLKADWAQASGVFGVIHPLIMLVCLPLYGRLLDRTSVVPVATLAFGVLALWPFSLALTTALPGAYAAYVCFGLGMAGVDVAWMLGANTFAPAGRIQRYMAIHVTLVGVRAMIAPFVGLAMKQQLGARPVFLTSGCLLLASAMLMFRLGRACAKGPSPCRESLGDGG